MLFWRNHYLENVIKKRIPKRKTAETEISGQTNNGNDILWKSNYGNDIFRKSKYGNDNYKNSGLTCPNMKLNSDLPKYYKTLVWTAQIWNLILTCPNMKLILTCRNIIKLWFDLLNYETKFWPAQIWNLILTCPNIIKLWFDLPKYETKYWPAKIFLSLRARICCLNPSTPISAIQTLYTAVYYNIST